MRVYYDFELRHSVSIENLAPLKYDFFNGIKAFVIKKLESIKYEIELEELIDAQKKIIICVLNPKKPSITFGRYSSDLGIKIDSCIQVDDLAYIQTKLSNDIELSGLNFLN